ncbi:MAG TPA: alpha/beta fold hydrolase [Dehalococcoidia bacterium]
MSWTSPTTIARQGATVKRDAVNLKCRLSVPKTSGPAPSVVFVHGLGSSKDSPRNLVVSERLLGAGIATVLFDLSGHGESSADPREGLEGFVDDLEAVCRWVQMRPELAPSRMAIAGSSLGAVVAIDAVQRRCVSPATLVLRAPPIERDQLAGVEIPTLIIVGTRDPLLDDVRRAASGRENVTVETVEGASHLFEEPGMLEEAVTNTTRWFKEKLNA